MQLDQLETQARKEERRKRQVTASNFVESGRKCRILFSTPSPTAVLFATTKRNALKTAER